MEEVVSSPAKRVARIILLNDIQLPFAAPYFVNASSAYSEQVGTNRQAGFVYGDLFFLYKPDYSDQ